MQKPWFKSKKDGVIWKPITWQGWMCVIAYIILVFNTFVSVDGRSHSASDTLIGIMPVLVILTLAFMLIAFVTSTKKRKR